MDQFCPFDLNDKDIFRYIKIDSSILSVLTNPSDSLCKRSIKTTPSSIQYINDQKKELCELAIKINPWTLEHIKEQTVDLCSLALVQHPDTYRLVRIVPNPDFETTVYNLEKKKAILDILK